MCAAFLFMDSKDSFYFGYFSKTKGLKGELQVYIETEFADAYTEANIVFVEIQGKLIPHFVLAYTNQGNKTASILLEDIDHIDKSTPLKGKKVFFPLSQQYQPAEEEVWLKNLPGFSVTDKTFGPMGTISEVREMPQQTIIAVQLGEKEILFPLTEDFIVKVNNKAKHLDVDLPDGLIALYLEA